MSQFRLSACIYFMAAFGMASGFFTTMPQAQAAKPNLVIIHTDEHNFRTLGCYRDLMSKEQALMWGDAVVTTPNIDWIAKNGALATSFYASTPVCSPSRAAFISGLYPHNTPVNTNNIPLSDHVITFAELLRRKGYKTGYIGKWHLDGGGKPQWEPKRNFGFEDNRYMFNRGHWKQFEDTSDGPRIKARKNNKPSYSVKGADEKSFSTDFLTDKTIDFILEHKDKPFCVMLSIPDPHGPDSVRPPYDTMFTDQKYQTPRTFNKPKENLPHWGQPAGGYNGMAKYYGMVKCIDDNVGKLLKTLRDEKLLDNTIVIFTSDHGDLRGEHHRQNKGVPYEGSAKVPFAIYYKGKIKAGTVINETISCVDFKPTILKMMGVDAGDSNEGRDTSELLLKGKAPSGWNDISFMRQTGTEEGWVAAVTDQYKLIYSTQSDPWLFDLKKDPDELTNYFTDKAYRQIVRSLSKQLKEYGIKYKDPRVANRKIQADLAWAIAGTDPYKSTPPAPKAVKKSRGKNRKK